MRKRFYGSGKLLLSGEYAVMDGIWALAVPTRFGQELIVEPTDRPGIHWKSLDEDGTVWFSEHFSHMSLIPNTHSQVSKNLSRLLRMCFKLNPKAFSNSPGHVVKTKMDFPANWGLGSSSTLIHTLSQWTDTDPYELLAGSFGGSGYDLAAAASEGPLLYSNQSHEVRIEPVSLKWPFADQLHFVYLNRKQDSREAISRYRVMHNPKKVLQRIGQISTALPYVGSLDEFASLLEEHEQLVSGLINLEPIKTSLFEDYPGVVKSLGAWGGDFIMVSGTEDDMDYFRSKGYKTIIPFQEMIKKAP